MPSYAKIILWNIDITNWLIGVGFIAGVIQSVLFSLGFGAFFLPIAQEFNVTRGALSGAFSAVRIQGGILGPFAGYLVDKIGITNFIRNVPTRMLKHSNISGKYQYYPLDTQMF